MEKSRDRRYQTAEAFADDLRRIQKLEPISAKPISTVGRVIRWSQRSPYRAAAVALLFILVGSGSFLVAKVPEYRRNREKALLLEQQELEQRAENLILNGYTSMDQGESKEAIRAFQEALLLTKESVEAVAGIALAHLDLNSPKAALAFMDEHSGLESVHVSLRAVRARALDDVGRVTESKQLASSVPKVHQSSDFFVLGLLELVARGGGEEDGWDRVLLLFKKAVARSTSPRLLYHVKCAQAAGKTLKVEEARECANVLITLWPDSFYAWYGRGAALSHRSDSAEAVAAYKRALELRPDFYHAHNGLGAVLSNRMHRHEEAAACFRKAIALNPRLTYGPRNLGIVHSRLGQHEESAAWFQRALAINPDSLKTRGSLGIALYRLEKYEEAAAVFSGGTQSDREDTPRVDTTELAASSAKDRARIAQEAFFKLAMTKEPRRIAHVVNYYRLLIDLRRLDEAEDLLRKFTAKRPRAYQAWFNLGRALMLRGKLEEAEKAYTRALEIRPDESNAWSNRAVVRMRQARLEEAEADCRQALLLDSDRPGIWNNLGIVLRKRGEAAAAEAAYRKGLELDPEHQHLAPNLARLLLDQQELDEAEKLLMRFTSACAQSTTGWHQYGRLRKLQGRPMEAEGAFRKALAIKKNLMDTRTMLGASLIDQGKFKKAEEEFLEVIEARPQFVKAKGNLALVLVHPERDPAEWDPERAMKLWRDIDSSLRTSDADYPLHLNLLALIQFAGGKNEEAIETEQQVIALCEQRDTDESEMTGFRRNLARFKAARKEKQRQ
jgi:tetratricopeptide (TPR) repeat protein